MKFQNDTDAKLFLIEIGQLSRMNLATKELSATNEEIDSFLKNRHELVKGLKDHRKSQNSKEQWRHKRKSMMKGIKSFHKSTEGKRFHRTLARHNATRISRNESIQDFTTNTTIYEVTEFLKGLNSAKTHLLIELEYFHPIQEQVELEELILENAINYINSIESNILRRRLLSEDELDFLFDITETNELMTAFAESTGLTKQEVEKKYEAIKDHLISQGKDPIQESTYPTLVSILKKQIKI
jgi:hypothetical protein